jgi:hypothetical protein
MLGELNGKPSSSPERDFAISRQVQRMRKRAKIDDRELHARACSDFISTNALVGLRSVILPVEIVNEASYFIVRILENFTSRLDENCIQEVLSPSFLVDNWRYGPGASNGVRGTHTVDKIVQDMTCTLPCEPFVSSLRQTNTYFQLFDKRKGKPGVTVVNGSRLTTVLKNETTRRTIAIEPSGNMALQLAAGMYLEGALRMIGLDIRDQQPKNKLLARRGSIDGSVATIDLKSASDMFSIDLVRKLMPPAWFKLLTSIRSEFIQTDSGEQVKLNMISTMGNGFTFPLMTLIITALVYANRRVRGGPPMFIDWSSTCVFGDDIIIPTAEYESLTTVLEQAGLVVNHDKSYFSGPFRESCGGDYYNGYDSTPFYVSSLDCDSAVFVAINQTFEWCARHNCLLPQTIALLVSYVKGKVHLVPEWHNPDEGVLTPRVARRYSFLRVSNKPSIHKENVFTLMLAIGGYIRSNGSDMFYSPRLFKNKVRVRHARLPNGYLDGADPLKRSSHVSSYIDAHTFLVE